METAGIIIEKILFIGILLAAGFLCGRLGLIDRETNRKATDLLLLVVSPCLILASYQVEYDAALLKNLLLAFGLSAACLLLHLALSYLFLRRGRRNVEVERMSVIYSNYAFMGIPLIEALYGAEGVLYLTAYITCFNTLFWTHGVIMMGGRCDRRLLLKKLCSPALISIAVGLALFLLRVRLPDLVLYPIEALGSMNTPLAMLVAGATIASSDLRACLRDRRAFYVLALRLLLVPAAALLLLCRLPVPAMLLYVILIAAARPTAAPCTMFALRYGRDAGYAAQIFTLTTLASVVTIPLITLLAELLI